MGKKQEVFKEWVVKRPPFANLTAKALENVEAIRTMGYDLVEPKMDGIWGTMVIDPDGQVRVYSRHGQLKLETEVPLWPLHQTILYGEFMKGSNWGIEHGVDGAFFTWDCIKFNGMDIRHKALHYRRRRAQDTILTGLPQWVQMNPQWSIHETRVRWQSHVVERGYEGLVFKGSQAPFGKSWARMKQVLEVDYVCMGFTASDAAKYKGCMVRSIIGGLYDNGKLVKTVNVSGITEEQRRAFYEDGIGYHGRVFTAKGNRMFKGGALRHPRFQRWHQDKDAAECTKAAALLVGGRS